LIAIVAPSSDASGGDVQSMTPILGLKRNDARLIGDVRERIAMLANVNVTPTRIGSLLAMKKKRRRRRNKQKTLSTMTW
jgi:hypothetical protein